MRVTLRSASFIVLLSASMAGAQQEKPLYRDPTASIPARVQDLLAKMTVEEKVAQLEGNWELPAFGNFKIPTIFVGDRLDEAMARSKLGNGIGTYVLLGEFTGTSGPANPRIGAEQRNLLQAWVAKNTRLGIPIMFHGEALHGAVTTGGTSFPQAVGLGSTWDPALLEKMFTTVGLETRAAGNVLALGPVLDLSRDPRYGRMEEMYSEDPFLVAQLGIAATRGLQGTSERLDDSHVFATAKHFVHGVPENGTNIGPSDFSERTMRSIFLYPFEQVIKNANIEAVMPSYNENNGGIPSNANKWLLKKVLRDEWGFKGLTVSDYMAIEQLATLHHVAADKPSAGVLAFTSGVDMELPTPSGFPALVKAINNGGVSTQELDEAVSRVLSAKFRAGLFEHPYVDANRAAVEVGNREHAKLARQVADEAIILLKNKDNLLPLDPAKIKILAVIGPNGKKARLGDYSGVPSYFVSIVDGLQKRVGPGTRVVFAEGCKISEPDTAPNLNTMAPYQEPSEATDRKLLQEAVETARTADVIVLALGGNEAVSRETMGDVGLGKPVIGDSDTLELPGRQNELVSEIAKLGKPMVAVLLNGRAYAIQKLSDTVPSIVEGWYLGQETGNAISDVIFGDVNPSGHLPVTIARNVGQLPVYYYKTPAARHGYVFSDESPLYPFGFGLSYTTFNFGEPKLDQDKIAVTGKARVSVDVKNSGSRAGDTVVQMYIHHVTSSVVQPTIILRGFKRVHLEPGKSEIVSFEVGPEELSIIDSELKRTVEPGMIDVLIGANSAETSKVRLTVTK